jgi:hypothetical protein
MVNNHEEMSYFDERTLRFRKELTMEMAVAAGLRGINICTDCLHFMSNSHIFIAYTRISPGRKPTLNMLLSGEQPLMMIYLSLPRSTGIGTGLYTVYGRREFAELVNEKNQAAARGSLTLTSKPPSDHDIDCMGGITSSTVLSGWIAQFCCEWDYESEDGAIETSGEFCLHLHIPNPFE